MLADALTSGKMIPLYYGLLALGLCALLLLLRAVRRSSGLTLPGIELGTANGDLEEPRRTREMVALDAVALSTLACTEAPLFQRILLAASTGFLVAGLLGLVLTRLSVGGVAGNVLIAVVAGVLSGGLAYWLAWRSTAVGLDCSELPGSVAEVTVPIPVDSYGQVAVNVHGRRVMLGARSVDSAPIPRGRSVRVVAMTGTRVIVTSAGGPNITSS